MVSRRFFHLVLTILFTLCMLYLPAIIKARAGVGVANSTSLSPVVNGSTDSEIYQLRVLLNETATRSSRVQAALNPLRTIFAKAVLSGSGGEDTDWQQLLSNISNEMRETDVTAPVKQALQLIAGHNYTTPIHMSRVMDMQKLEVLLSSFLERMLLQTHAINSMQAGIQSLTGAGVEPLTVTRLFGYYLLYGGSVSDERGAVMAMTSVVDRLFASLTTGKSGAVCQ